MGADAGQVLIYQSESGQTRLEVRLVDETVWLTQAQMAELFQTSANNISLHLKNIFEDKELEEMATAEDFSVVRLEGGRRVRRNKGFVMDDERLKNPDQPFDLQKNDAQP